MKPDQKYMVFDVESVGLHGEGFACGYVVLDADGKVLQEHAFACNPDDAWGDDQSRLWVAAHVDTLSLMAVVDAPAVRKEFWDQWMAWKEEGAVLVADCGWPVEARFLAACVDDSTKARGWHGPYPLHELATFRLAAGFDPVVTGPRLANELPEHNPLMDARQSARLLREALARLFPPSMNG